MSGHAPLTRKQVAEWPSMGPIAISPHHVLPLFDEMDSLHSQRDELLEACEVLFARLVEVTAYDIKKLCSSQDPEAFLCEDPRFAAARAAIKKARGE